MPQRFDGDDDGWDYHHEEYDDYDEPPHHESSYSGREPNHASADDSLAACGAILVVLILLFVFYGGRSVGVSAPWPDHFPAHPHEDTRHWDGPYDDDDVPWGYEHEYHHDEF